MLNVSSIPQRSVALAVLVFLSACSGEPSASDIEQAVKQQVKQEVKGLEAFAGSAAASALTKLIPEVKSVKKIGCKADGEKAYVCDVEMEVMQGGSVNKGVAPMRFVKGSGGWMAQ